MLVKGTPGILCQFRHISCYFDLTAMHDDVIKWKHFSRYWPFVWGIHRSPVNSPHKGQWRRVLMFSLIYAWINSWVNNMLLVIWDTIAFIIRQRNEQTLVLPYCYSYTNTENAKILQMGVMQCSSYLQCQLIHNWEHQIWIMQDWRSANKSGK